MFRPEDYQGLYFKVMQFDSGDSDKVLKMPEFEDVELDRLHKQQLVQIIKYLVLMYDKHSPLVSKYPDLETRKEKAIDLAGINFGTQRKLIERLTSLNDDDLLTVVAQMLRKQGEQDFSLLISQEQLFYELLQNVLDPIESDSDKDQMTALEKKAKLSGMLEEVGERIEKYRARYYRGDDDMEEKVRKHYRLTPENIAASMSA